MKKYHIAFPIDSENPYGLVVASVTGKGTPILHGGKEFEPPYGDKLVEGTGAKKVEELCPRAAHWEFYPYPISMFKKYATAVGRKIEEMRVETAVRDGGSDGLACALAWATPDEGPGDPNDDTTLPVLFFSCAIEADPENPGLEGIRLKPIATDTEKGVDSLLNKWSVVVKVAKERPAALILHKEDWKRLKDTLEKKRKEFYLATLDEISEIKNKFEKKPWLTPIALAERTKKGKASEKVEIVDIQSNVCFGLRTTFDALELPWSKTSFELQKLDERIKEKEKELVDFPDVKPSLIRERKRRSKRTSPWSVADRKEKRDNLEKNAVLLAFPQTNQERLDRAKNFEDRAELDFFDNDTMNATRKIEEAVKIYQDLYERGHLDINSLAHYADVLRGLRELYKIEKCPYDIVKELEGKLEKIEKEKNLISPRFLKNSCPEKANNLPQK